MINQFICNYSKIEPLTKPEENNLPVSLVKKIIQESIVFYQIQKRNSYV